MKKIILLASLAFSINANAQVPSYVPTNGLVGWWPFNGNANDESGNGNNGAVNGATLTTDRFGNANKAYSFDGVDDNILIQNTLIPNIEIDYSISTWVNLQTIIGGNVILSDRYGASYAYKYSQGVLSDSSIYANIYDAITENKASSDYNAIPNFWYNLISVYSSSTNYLKLYINGILTDSIIRTASWNNSSNPTTIGQYTGPVDGNYLNGKIDDIGFWNRALTQQEITNLYTATNCANNTTISPQTNSLTTASTATFTATTSDPNPSYVWQSNFGQGFQTLNNFGNYSGVSTSNLNITNIQLPNHTQPIRVITTSGNCIDTSNVAVINILDTCLVTVYDTLLTTVTDTLVINATITGINPPNNLNTVKVFPNPANTHITIDYGNFSSMSGYTLKIVNAIGQTVFTTPINQQSSYIDLSTWMGNGIYYVQLIDTQNNTIENRKIVIQ